MKISMMSLMMEKYSPKEIVKTAVNCRMAGIDWVTEHGTTAKKLKKLCDDAKLPIVAHTPIIPMDDWTVKKFLEAFKKSLDFAVTLGAPVMMIPVRKLGFGSRELDRAQWTEFFVKAGPLAKKAGVTLTFEAMGFALAPVKSAAECLEILNAAPDVRITFDSGNVETVEDPIISYCKLADKVMHVHFKDYLQTACPNAEGFHPQFNRKAYRQVMFGKGNSDLAGLWQVMKQHHYKGYVNFETSDAELPEPEVLRILCDRMRNW